MQKTQQDKHSGLNSSYPNVSGHLATRLDIIKECAQYFPRCCTMMLTDCFTVRIPLSFSFFFFFKFLHRFFKQDIYLYIIEVFHGLR